MWKAFLLAALICNPANEKECRLEWEAPVGPWPPMLTPVPPPMPTPPVPGALDSQLIAMWKAAVVTKLGEQKYYPEAAVGREHGVARVFFAIDREGRLLESRIVQSSGSANLDAAALDTLKRAEPFPPPPDSLKGERIDLTIPFRFNPPPQAAD
jgi:protein TonB